MKNCYWFTGCPASGKTTIGKIVADKIGAILLDGDIIRSSYISKGLGFSKEDRYTHLMRVGEIAKLIVESGSDVVACFVSPIRDARSQIRRMFPLGNYHEIFVSSTYETRLSRDPKGLYRKAINKEITGLTGYDSSYENSPSQELTIVTDYDLVSESVSKVMRYVESLKKPCRRCVYIGRWSPFHKGHYAIIKSKLDEGKPVLVLIRDTPLSSEDPWTANERKQMIESTFVGYDVVAQIVPDIASVVVGRKVGYDLEEMKMPTDIENISGTAVRDSLVSGTDYWKDKVSDGTRKWLTEVWKK